MSVVEEDGRLVVEVEAASALVEAAPAEVERLGELGVGSVKVDAKSSARRAVSSGNTGAASSRVGLCALPSLALLLLVCPLSFDPAPSGAVTLAASCASHSQAAALRMSVTVPMERRATTSCE